MASLKPSIPGDLVSSQELANVTSLQHSSADQAQLSLHRVVGTSNDDIILYSSIVLIILEFIYVDVMCDAN